MAINTRDKRASAGSLLGLEMLPLADGTVGTADRLHVAGFYSGIAAAVGIAYVLAGMPFYWATASRPANVLPYLEVFFKATTGTVYARLLDVTVSPVTAVANSGLSTSTTSLIRKRTNSSLVFTDGHEYMLQLGKQGSDAGTSRGSRLQVIYP